MEQGCSSQRVFRTPELTGLILDDLADGGLARMARVAAFAHEPSIKRLWGRSLCDVDRLAQLFPQGLLVSRTKDNRLAFTRNLEESDWTRFKSYSVHITGLNLLQPQYSPEFFSHFVTTSNEVFPHLQRISAQWPAPGVYMNSEWFALAGKALRGLNIHALDTPEVRLSSNNNALSSLLQQLPLRSPNLKKLTLPGNPGLQGTVLVVASFCFVLPPLLRLTKLVWTWPNIPPEIVITILHHPNLRDVTLRTIQPLPDTGQMCFPALRRLCLQSSTEETAWSWLSGLARPDLLERLNLELTDENPTTNLPLPIPFILPLSQAAYITEIDITFLREVPISWKYFEPILDCELVTTFFLALGPSLEDFNDHALKRLATSWRVLEKLEIMSKGFSPTITVCDLEPLALYCPKLRSLSLDVLSHNGGAKAKTNLSSTGNSKFTSDYNLNLDLYLCQDEANALGRSGNGTEVGVDPRHVAKVLRRFWPTLKPENVQITACGPHRSKNKIIQAHLNYVEEFMEEMDLHEREAKGMARRHAKSKRLLEEKNDRMVKEKAEENARFVDEWDQLARKCALLEEELSRARASAPIKKEE